MSLQLENSKVHSKVHSKVLGGVTVLPCQLVLAPVHVPVPVPP